MTGQVEEFLDQLYVLDRHSHRLVNQAILVLERNGPADGRPLVDSITASRLSNLKELRPPPAGAHRDQGSVRLRSLAFGGAAGCR